MGGFLAEPLENRFSRLHGDTESHNILLYINLQLSFMYSRERVAGAHKRLQTHLSRRALNYCQHESAYIIIVTNGCGKVPG